MYVVDLYGIKTLSIVETTHRHTQEKRKDLKSYSISFQRYFTHHCKETYNGLYKEKKKKKLGALPEERACWA
jgi:transposase-like protein